MKGRRRSRGSARKILEAILSIGKLCATAQDIARATKIPRSTIHSVAASLAERGVLTIGVVQCEGRRRRGRPKHLFCVSRERIIKGLLAPSRGADDVDDQR